VWAGGDVKLMAAISSILPFGYSLRGSLDLPIYAFFIFLYSVMAIFPLTILYILAYYLKKRDLRFFFKFFYSLAFSWFSIVFFVLLYDVHFILPFLLMLFFRVLKKSSKFKAYSKYIWKVWFFILMAVFFVCLFLRRDVVFYSLPFLLVDFIVLLYFSGRDALTYSKSVDALEDGDVVGDIWIFSQTSQKPAGSEKEGKNNEKIENNEKIGKIEKISYRDFFLRLMKGEKINVFLSPFSAGGIEEEQIPQIRKIFKENGIETIKLKKTMPFVPSIFMAHIVFLLFGDMGILGSVFSQIPYE